MPPLPSCPTCSPLLIAYTNVVHGLLGSLFDDEEELTARSTPKATWARFKGHCAYCGQECPWDLRTRSREPSKRAHRNVIASHSPQIDHWIPLSLGGPASEWNMVLSCRGCNTSKGKALRDYPPSLIEVSPEFADRIAAAIALTHLAWGELVSPRKSSFSCESLTYLAERWKKGWFTFHPRFGVLCSEMDKYATGACNKVSPRQAERLLQQLERETERELRF